MLFRSVAEKINKLVPDYMVMGERGGSMEHEMPLPENTLPMMTGTGPFGPLEMGGMFTVVKVREGLARDDYRDPGWYKHPSGTVAYEWQGETPLAERKPLDAAAKGTQLRARKPAAASHKH